jgi:hypothetical protein
MEIQPSLSHFISNVIRWIARLISIVVILIWGFFLTADIIGGSQGGAQLLTKDDYIQFFMMAIWFVGLIVAWRKEFIGGIIILIAFAIQTFVNYRILLSIGFLIPLTGLLFLISWWLRKPQPSAK